MCFSAEASFIAGAVLTTAGAISIKKAGTRSQLPFAGIPLLFGIQQFTEGFLWLALLYPGFAFLQQPTTYLFLIFAQVVWPSWVPFSILMLEEDKKRKKILSIMLATGLLVSAYLAFRLIIRDVTAEITDHHIYYDFGYSASIIRSFGIMYFIATVVTPFLSTVKKMWAISFTILPSYIIAKMYFENYVISVWCFLAAVISIWIYMIIRDLNKPKEKAILKTI